MGHHLDFSGIFFGLPGPSHLDERMVGYDVRVGQDSPVLDDAPGAASGFMAFHLPGHIIIVTVVDGIDLYHRILDVRRLLRRCRSA